MTRFLHLAFLILVSLSGFAYTSYVIPRELEDVVGCAELIVEAKVAGASLAPRAGETNRYHLDVVKTLVGHQESKRLLAVYVNPGIPGVSFQIAGSGIEGQLEEGKTYIFIFAPEARPLVNERQIFRVEPLKSKKEVLLAWKKRKACH